MNKRKSTRQHAVCLGAALLLLCGMAMPVYAEPENPEQNPTDVTVITEQTTSEITDTETNTIAQTSDVTAETETETTTETTTTTEVTTTGTTIVRTEMTPPDPLEMIESEENATGGITICSFRWTCEHTVEIPAQIDGKPVTEIAAEAFKYCYADNVLLPDTVTHIGNRAFEGCVYLESITIPSACVSIGEAAFSGCKALETVNLSDSVQEIGRNAFAETAFLAQQTGDAITLGNGILYAYRGTAEAYTVPDTVRIIGAEAFAGNETLRKVVISENVKQIQQGAFSGCSALAEIETPDTINAVAADAFADTKWLTSGKEDYRILGKMLIAYSGKDSVAEVPDGVQVINDEAFAAQKGITTVRLPASVRKICDGAFRDCPSLQVAEFGDQLTTIGADAFRNCRTLNYLRFGYALETIGDHAFVDCPNLVELYLPDTVTSIGEQALGYGYDEKKGYQRMKNEMVLYANTAVIREYANAETIAHQPLPDAENTAPAPIVTEPENVRQGFGTVRGKAWIPAVALGGLLILAVGIYRGFRRKKELASD